MMFHRCFVALVLIGLCRFSSVEAQSLKLRRTMDDAEKKLQTAVDNLNKYCGTNITVKIDWSNAQQAALEKGYIQGNCENAIFGVRSICRDDLGKQSLQEKIEAVLCVFGPKSFALKDGTLTCTTNDELTGSSLESAVENYLEETL